MQFARFLLACFLMDLYEIENKSFELDLRYQELESKYSKLVDGANSTILG